MALHTYLKGITVSEIQQSYSFNGIHREIRTNVSGKKHDTSNHLTQPLKFEEFGK